MKLTNEVVVPAPLERTWPLLLDVPRMVRALPGATVEPGSPEGVYRGSLKVRLGPVAMEYEGSARLEDVDEDEHIASFHVEGRERRGHGGAAATITNRLLPEADGTRLVVRRDERDTRRAGGNVLEQRAHLLRALALARRGEQFDRSGESLHVGLQLGADVGVEHVRLLRSCR